MQSLSLYKLSEKYQFLLNELCDPETGVVDETALAKLNDIEDSIENKCINVTKLFKSIEVMKKAIKLEKDRIAKREKAFKKQIERLKSYLQFGMENSGVQKIQCPEFTIAIQNNPPSVGFTDAEEVPAEYEKKLPRELDIQKILSDLKNGIAIPGAYLVQKQSLRIK